MREEKGGLSICALPGVGCGRIRPWSWNDWGLQLPRPAESCSKVAVL